MSFQTSGWPVFLVKNDKEGIKKAKGKESAAIKVNHKTVSSADEEESQDPPKKAQKTLVEAEKKRVREGASWGEVLLAR